MIIHHIIPFAATDISIHKFAAKKTALFHLCDFTQKTDRTF
ncbi:hypothetical protein HMPREF9996_00976 [Aggregatibacter actinomycetemcomitans Y4]|nr:hypothetical protein HMPREF9996_00976 [Aggregatibacter actinomycetemcomitans Y4]